MSNIKKLVVELYEENKKSILQNQKIELYNKFEQAGFISEQSKLNKKQIREFKTIRDLFYYITKANNKVVYSSWKKFVKISDIDLYSLCLEYPIFLNRLDDTQMLLAIIGYFAPNEISKILSTPGLKMEIRAIIKSYDRTTGKVDKTWVKKYDAKIKKSNNKTEKLAD